MPTTSQALLIMRNKWEQNETKSLKTFKSVYKKSLKPYPVTRVDMNEMLLKHVVKEIYSDQEMETFSQLGQKSSEYDSFSCSFAWNFLSEKESELSCDSEKLSVNLRPAESAQNKSTVTNLQSENTRTKTVKKGWGKVKKTVTFAKPPECNSCRSKENMLSCSGLQMQVTGKLSDHSNVNNVTETWSPRISSTENIEKSRMDNESSKFQIQDVYRNPNGKHHYSGYLTQERETEITDEKVDNKPEKYKPEDIQPNTIYPSVYMRERLQEKRPLDACFSLKDNELRSHRDLKHLIQNQTGVNLTRMIYEPLSIRSDGEAPRNRWQVTTASADEIGALVSSGLLVDGKRITVVLADKIMEREYRTHWNLQNVQNERKKAWGKKRRKNSATVKPKTKIQSVNL